MRIAIRGTSRTFCHEFDLCIRIIARFVKAMLVGQYMTFITDQPSGTGPSSVDQETRHGCRFSPNIGFGFRIARRRFRIVGTADGASRSPGFREPRPSPLRKTEPPRITVDQITRLRYQGSGAKKLDNRSLAGDVDTPESIRAIEYIGRRVTPGTLSIG